MVVEEHTGSVKVSTSLHFGAPVGTLEMTTDSRLEVFTFPFLLDPENAADSYRKRYLDAQGFVHYLPIDESFSTYYRPFASIDELVNEVNARTEDVFTLVYQDASSTFKLLFNPCASPGTFVSTPFSRWLGFSTLDVNVTHLTCPFVLHGTTPQFFRTFTLSHNPSCSDTAVLQRLQRLLQGLHLEETVHVDLISGDSHTVSLNGVYDLETLEAAFSGTGLLLAMDTKSLDQVVLKSAFSFRLRSDGLLQSLNFQKAHAFHLPLDAYSPRHPFELTLDTEDGVVRVTSGVPPAAPGTLYLGGHEVTSLDTYNALRAQRLPFTVVRDDEVQLQQAWPLDHLMSLDVTLVTPSYPVQHVTLYRLAGNHCRVIPPLINVNVGPLPKFDVRHGTALRNNLYVNHQGLPRLQRLLGTTHFSVHAKTQRTDLPYVRASLGPRYMYVQLVHFPLDTQWKFVTAEGDTKRNVCARVSLDGTSLHSPRLEFLSPQPLTDLRFRFLDEHGHIIRTRSSFTVEVHLLK